MNPRLLLVLLCALVLGGCEREVIPPPPGNTPPVLTLVRPTTGQLVRVGQELELAAQVEDAEEGASLEENVVWVSSRSGQLAYGGSVTVVLTEPGEQTLTATVTDSGGLVASASLSLVVLSSDAPSLAIQEPAAHSVWNLGQVLTLHCEALSASGEPLPDSAIQWTSALSGPLAVGARVEVSLGVSGEDTLTCTATDPATDVRTTTRVPVTVKPTQAPALRIRRPEMEALYVKAGQPAPHAPTIVFDATAHDFNLPEGGEALASTVEWTLEPGGTRLGTGAALTHTFTTPGEYTVVATVTDSLGNQARDSVRVHLVTNLPPRCDILRPRLNGERLLQGAPTELEARCVDPETGLEPVATWHTSAAEAPLGEADETRAVLSTLGAQVLSACAADPGDPDLRGCGQRSVRVVTNSAPGECTVLAPLESRVNAGVPLALRGSATDAEDPQLDLRYTWTASRDGLLAEGATTTTRRLLSAGAQTLTLTVTDPWGLTCTATTSLVVNGPPQTGISKVEQGATSCLSAMCREGMPLAVSGSASDLPEGLASLEWLDNLAGSFGTTDSATLPSPAVGKHTLVLRATDLEGAVSRGAVSFAVLPEGRTRLLDPLVSSTEPLTSLALGPGEVRYVDGKSASVLRVPASAGTAVTLGASGLSIFRQEMSTGPVLFVGTTNGLERCIGTTCQRYRGGALSAAGEAVRALVALESPDLLLLATDKGLVLTRASDPSAGGPSGTIVGRRVLDGMTVRQVAVSPLSTERELKLWAATAEGLAELTLTMEAPFEPAIALVSTVLHGAGALPDKDVRSIALSPEGQVYAGTSKGWASPGQSGPALRAQPWSFPDDQIQTLAFERRTVEGQVRDVLWAGTKRGLIRYDLGLDIATRFEATDGLPSEDVRTLVLGADGTRYIGTAAGLAVYAGP